MPRTVTVTPEAGILLDLLLFRAYGRAGNTSDMLKAALALNPGLAAVGPVIPRGTPVILPDPPGLQRASVRRAVNLFDD